MLGSYKSMQFSSPLLSTPLKPNPDIDALIKASGLVIVTSIVILGAVKITDIWLESSLKIAHIKLETAVKIADIWLESAEKIAVIKLETAGEIVDKVGETAEKRVLLSKAGSTEEAATLKKTEKMAHAAALGSANGATDALKSRWWVLWPW